MTSALRAVAMPAGSELATNSDAGTDIRDTAAMAAPSATLTPSHSLSGTATTLCSVPVSLLTTTVDAAAHAQQLAQGAVQARWAACAQVEAITSHYVWQGQLEAAAEWRVVFKTLPAAVEGLVQWLRSQHPYTVPQLLVRTEWAAADYAAWVAQGVDLPKAV